MSDEFAIYGIVLVLILLVAIAVIAVIETIALWEKTESLTSHEDEDVMSVSIGLKIRKRTYLLVLLYIILRFGSIIGEIGLISRSTHPSGYSSQDLHNTDSWNFGLTVYARQLPVYVILAIFGYFDYYLSQLCIVLSGLRPRFPIKQVRIIIIGAFVLLTMTLGNNYTQLWIWAVCLMGLAHLAVLASGGVNMHNLYSNSVIAAQLREKHLIKVLVFVCGATCCLLLAGGYYIVLSLYYCRSHLAFWLTSAPAVLLDEMMQSDPSLRLEAAGPRLTAQLYWDMFVCYGLLEALPLLVLVASMSATCGRKAHGEGEDVEAARGKGQQGRTASHLASMGEPPSLSKSKTAGGIVNGTGPVTPISLSGALAARAQADPLDSSYSSFDVVIDRNYGSRTPTPVVGAMSFVSTAGTHMNGNGSHANSKFGTELQPLLT